MSISKILLVSEKCVFEDDKALHRCGALECAEHCTYSVVVR